MSLQLLSCPSLTEAQDFGASLEGLCVIVFSNTPNADFSAASYCKI